MPLCRLAMFQLYTVYHSQSCLLERSAKLFTLLFTVLTLLAGGGGLCDFGPFDLAIPLWEYVAIQNVLRSIKHNVLISQMNFASPIKNMI